ncbi:P-loop containing nucleoside triphosphate hydrolases superfamily protein [Hibiscus syriacus]|uniref:P-loop containing nucleoside triphosphate hydrolases superfamily protein n=1 Tax=Hibiscus syriacus TaxID=106335 RepID=A0A6A2YXF0_HIBSY|nr:protein SRC2-like [Hibiscus syriacus]KAE8684103.1 P-loop containing nucleoside triphosphate hydrolases superfamily protein [Hibiscus syriacus]
MELMPLEINLHCAKDLKNVNIFTKMNVYAVVSVNGDRRTAQKTPIDKECGAYPNWNHTMNMTIDEAIARRNHHNLVIRLKSGLMLRDKEIGTVQVPIKDLLDHNDGNSKVEYQNVSYSVRLPNGKTKGVLSFSYKFREPFTMPSVTPPPIAASSSMYVDRNNNMSNKHGEKLVMAYPPPPPGYPEPSSGHHAPPPQGVVGYAYPAPSGYPPPLPYGYQQGLAPGYVYPTANGGYGYPPSEQKPKKSKKGGMGAGLGLGIAGGLLGGMLIGNMVEDAYEAGVEDGLDYDF